MKTHQKILIIFVMLLATVFVNCSEVNTGSLTETTEADSSASISLACDDKDLVEITQDINDNTTWYSDTIYIIRKWNFYVNATLVIEPGAIIKFHHTEGPEMVLGGSGTILAEGTEEEPIIFTSYKDDAHGCDNNGDGSSTTPAMSDWGSIDTNGLNGSIFDYCEFYYGGADYYTTTLRISAGSIATVTNSTFAHNNGGDESGWYGALDASDAEVGTVIQNNVFYDNIRPLSINTLFSLDDSNQFANPLDELETNTYNGIFVDTLYNFSSHISWHETEVAYVIDDNDVWIETGATLTLGEDVALKFRPYSELTLEDGTDNIVFEGSENDKEYSAIFTSYKDDNVKGDTNADGSATTPAADDWEGIYDDTAPLGGPYYLSWSNIYYD